jgi:hypothetical protein
MQRCKILRGIALPRCFAQRQRPVYRAIDDWSIGRQRVLSPGDALGDEALAVLTMGLQDRALAPVTA